MAKILVRWTVLSGLLVLHGCTAARLLRDDLLFKLERRLEWLATLEPTVERELAAKVIREATKKVACAKKKIEDPGGEVSELQRHSRAADAAITKMKRQLAALEELAELRRDAAAAASRYTTVLTPESTFSATFFPPKATRETAADELKKAVEADTLEAKIRDYRAELVTFLATAEQSGGNALAQAKLRAEIQALKVRAKELRSWRQADRTADIEKVRADIDTLLDSVPDPALVRR